jgi:hypothetical protein
MDVKRISMSLILGLALISVQSGYAQATAPKPKQESRQDAKKKGRVEAEEPTVMTVKGKVTPLEQRKVTQVEEERNFGQKIGYGIRTGVVGTAKGIAKGIGWLLDPKNEIPSERERQEQSAQQPQ